MLYLVVSLTSVAHISATYLAPKIAVLYLSITMSTIMYIAAGIVANAIKHVSASFSQSLR